MRNTTIKITVGNTTLLLSDAMELCKQLAPLFNGSTAETEIVRKVAPTPQPQKLATARAKQFLHLSDRTKFFVGLIWEEMMHDSERVVWAVKNPLAFARELGIESECTPKVLEELTAWTSRVKDVTITRSAWEWAETFSDKILRRQFKHPADGSFYSKNNINQQQRN